MEHASEQPLPDAVRIELPEEGDTSCHFKICVRVEEGQAHICARVERLLIENVLAATGGKKPAAAEQLGIALKTLYNKLNANRKPDVANAASTPSDQTTPDRQDSGLAAA